MSIYWLLPIFMSLHITEEFGFPGGFKKWYQDYKPDLKASMTDSYFFWVNAILLIAAIMMGITTDGGFWGLRGWLVFTASLGFNAIFHIVGAIKTKKYSPGLVTSALLYLPLTVGGFTYFISNGSIGIFWAIFCLLLAPLAQYLFDLYHNKASQ